MTISLVSINKVRAQLGLTPLALTADGHYVEALHPRGRDGRWIEKFGFVKVLGHGLGSGDRTGQVTRVDPDGAVVKTTDGQVGKYPFHQLEHSDVKALIPDAAGGKTVIEAARTQDPMLVAVYGMHQATPDERKARAVPPGWTNVLIANDKTQPLQIIGLDAAGRDQRRYTAEFTEHQAAAKLERIRRLHDEIGKLDHALLQNFSSDDAAAALMLIRHMGMRPGSTTDTKAKVQAYGAITLQARHVTFKGDTAVFDFIGKDGVKIHLQTSNHDLVNMLKKRVAASTSPNDSLFKTNPARVAAFMKQYVDPGFKVKDLRTYLANDLATQFIAAMPVPTTMAQFRSARLQVARQVSAQLGNTPQMALASYINPTVFGPWEQALAETTLPAKPVVASSGQTGYNTTMADPTQPPSPMQAWLDSTSFESFDTPQLTPGSPLPEVLPEEDDE